jgi:hypothetical protein
MLYNKLMTIKKHILYPFFLVTSANQKSEFWKNVYENLAYGISVENCYIQNNALCYSNEKITLSVKLDQSDPSLEDNIYNMLIDNNLLSDSEKNMIKIDSFIHKYMENQHDNKWFNIKKKNIKDIILEKYVITQKKTNNLSNKQTKQLLTFLIVALLFKSITHTEITFSNNTISNIDGIEFSNQNIIIHKNLFENVGNLIICDDTGSEWMSTFWTKYLDNIKKKIL